MRWLRLALVVAACGQGGGGTKPEEPAVASTATRAAPSDAAPPPPGSVVISVRPPAVGQRRTMQTNILMRYVMDGEEYLERANVDQVDEILAVEGAVVTRLRTTYRNVEHAATSRRGETSDAPHDGKTYEAFRLFGKLVITRDGAEVSAEESERFRGEFEWIGQPDPVLAIAGRPLAPGVIAVSAREAGALVGLREPDAKVKEIVLLLDRVEGDVARFTYRTTWRREVFFPLDLGGEGTLAIDVRRGAMTELTFIGKMIAVPGAPSVDGTIEVRVVATEK
jgi:hypothetical protein